MRRREFITLMASAAPWPLTARAQQSTMPMIGLLGSESPDLWAAHMRAFSQGLKEAGYVEGRNVGIEYRWAQSHNDRLPALAADLAGRRVTVIATPGSTPATLAAKDVTSTIPIILGTTTARGADVALRLSWPRKAQRGPPMWGP